jgi:hypothetical protein
MKTNNENITDKNRSVLEPRAIGELTYRFRIPSYQRGYRWERRQVEQLLNDIAESRDDAPYYLQPIVVAPASHSSDNDSSLFDYDLIDGQQRLTTIYLILKALSKAKESNSDKIARLAAEGRIKELTELTGLISTLAPIDTTPGFKLVYQTRESSQSFLSEISELDETDSRIAESPDHLYMWHAYRTIQEWLASNRVTDVERVAKALKERVKVIWYELPDTVTDWKKFTDLNIGKIPLTNSELVKALFLRSGNFSGENERERDEYEKQILVSQWDQIEIELSDIDFWGFLTKDDPDNYPTKIDLLFNLIAGNHDVYNKDKLYTFNFFVSWFDGHSNLSGKKKWEEIYLQYQRLRDWYKDRSIYHKLGYLVSIDYPHNALLKVFKYAHPDHPGRTFRTTDRVRNILDLLVRKSLQFPKDKNFANVKTFADLSYNIAEDPDTALNTAHHDMIKRYLTLYNIMVTESASQTMRYSFACHNTVDGGWSLEHIHAQKSQTLNKTWQWIKWIANHRNSLVRLKNTLIDKATIVAIDQLIVEMDGFKEGDQRDKFNAIADKYRMLMDSLTGAKDLYQDAMTNMALLGKHDNSTLSNSTFDVKRHKIMRRLGTNFVPIATERVFLKAISGETKDNIQYQCDTEHMFYWGADDRAAYLHDIKEKLTPYLK